MLDQPHELTFGGFVLSSSAPADVPWLCEATAKTSFGQVVPIVEALRQTLLIDGAEMVRTGTDNREVSVQVRITATDGQAMAQAEHALDALVDADRPPPLVWTPPMVGAWPMAFDVLAVRVDRVYDDMWDFDERFRQRRTWELVFTCLPYVHDLEPVVIPALPVPELPAPDPVRISLDDCNSAAGWALAKGPTAEPSSTSGPGVVSGSIVVGVARTATVPTPWLAAVRTGWAGAYVVDWDTYPYLGFRVGVQVDPDGGDPAAAVVAPHVVMEYDTGAAWVSSPPVAAIGLTGVGYELIYDLVFPAPPEDAVAVRVRVDFPAPPLVDQWVYLSVAEVFAIDRALPAAATGRQVARTTTVEGSAPTGAAIVLDTAETGGGPLLAATALIYTGPSPVVRLRPWVTSSALPFAGAAYLSGARNDLSSPMVMRVPVADLVESTYDLLARMHYTGQVVVQWSARVVDATGGPVPGSDQTTTGECLLVNLPATPDRIETIASIQLPILGSLTPPEDADWRVEITLSVDEDGDAVYVDEGWLADVGDGERAAVTIIHEPSAYDLSRVEVRSPQIDAVRYATIGTWIGHGSQDIGYIAPPGKHRFKPGPLHIFTACDVAQYPGCSLTYYRRYSHHPGPPLPDVA